MTGAIILGIAGIVLFIALRAQRDDTEPGMEDVLDSIRTIIDEEDAKRPDRQAR